ncbi:hypothetical protein ACFX13_009199 [Malus domestica]
MANTTANHSRRWPFWRARSHHLVLHLAIFPYKLSFLFFCFSVHGCTTPSPPNLANFGKISSSMIKVSYRNDSGKETPQIFEDNRGHQAIFMSFFRSTPTSSQP